MKRSALKRKPKRRKPDERERMAEFRAAAEAQGGACLACGSTSRLVGHHAVHRQHIERADGDPWAPDVAMAICTRCHDRHHCRIEPLALGAVPVEARRFAVELLGPSAAARYWEIYYDCSRDDA